jgi:hypothetical protein
VVRFPAGAGTFSPRYRVQTGSGANPDTQILFPGVKRPDREADHSPSPSVAEVKNTWNYTSTSPYVIMGGT